MKKEMTLAIALGLLVGLILTIGAYRARRAIDQAQHNTPELPFLSQTPIPSPSNSSQSAQLILKEPGSDALVTEKSVHISGTTFADTIVLLLMGGKESLTTSDTIGNFSFPVTLEEDVTAYTVKVLPENGPALIHTDTIVLQTKSSASVSATPSTTR